MSAVLHKMESDLEGYKKTFTKGPFIDYEKQSSLSIYEAWVKIWEKNSWEERSTLFSSLLEMNWSGRLPTTNKIHSLKR